MSNKDNINHVTDFIGQTVSIGDVIVCPSISGNLHIRIVKYISERGNLVTQGILRDDQTTMLVNPERSVKVEPSAATQYSLKNSHLS